MGEKKLLVAEIKGLLRAVRVLSTDAEFQLSVDNLSDLVVETDKIRNVLNRIDDKIRPIILEELNDDSIY